MKLRLKIPLLPVTLQLVVAMSFIVKIVIQGESKKTDTFVIHLNIKCISFF